MDESTLTGSGQISVTASLRKSIMLRPGQRVKFVPISDKEFRVVVETTNPAGPMAMLGYARKLGEGPVRRPNEWMRELRDGEKP